MDRELSNGVSAFHFDFLKNINCPKLSCQESYYSSKLTTYAFGIHSAETERGTVYTWPETVAPKNPDTVLSCLDRHLAEIEEEHRRWCIFYADNTRSQNKNYTVVKYFEYLVSSGSRQRIDFKFFLPGHSYGPVDRNTGQCEMIFRRHQTIETPMDYVSLINDKLSPRIHWLEMEQRHFKFYSRWLKEKYFEQRKDTNGQPCHFNEMTHFNFGIGERVDPKDNEVKVFRHPGYVWMRRSLDPEEEPTVLDLRVTAEPEIVLSRNNLKLLNNRPIKLTDKKCNDLLNLCKFLSPDAKTYYHEIARKK